MQTPVGIGGSGLTWKIWQGKTCAVQPMLQKSLAMSSNTSTPADLTVLPPNIPREHLSSHAFNQLCLCAVHVGRMYARPVVHTARTPNAAGGKTATAPTSKAGKATSSGAGASSSKQGTGAGSSNGASSSSSAGAAAGSSSAASSSRGRQEADHRSEPAASVAPWLDEQYCGYDDEDDEDDFTIYESDSYSRGGAGSSRQADRSCSSSRLRARMIKPVRQVPKGAAVSPAVASAACPVVNTPMGRSPGNGGFHVGSWGVAGKSPNSCGGMWAAAAAGVGSVGTPGTSGSSSQAAGSAPGSGRRARRNARRAAMDAGDYD